MASPGGAILTTENAAPYILDFTVIDLNRDGKISEHEFKNACHGGWVKDPSTVKKLKAPSRRARALPMIETCGLYRLATIIHVPQLELGSLGVTIIFSVH